MNFKTLSTFSAFTLIAASTVALATEYEVDPAHSNIEFEIRHLVTKTKGNFKEFKGEFVFDEKKPDLSHLKFTVKVPSINTDNQKRDEHLKSEEFFDIAKFPEASFEGKTFKKAGKDKYKLAGDLTIHGVTKAVIFDVEYNGTAKDPWGNDKAGFQAITELNREDFGLKWNKPIVGGVDSVLLGKQVKLIVEIEANAKVAKKVN